MRSFISPSRPRASGRRAPKWLYDLVALAIMLAVMASAAPPHVFALNSGDLTFTLVTPFLAQDSNNSCAAGPKAMYIEVLVTNPAGGVGTESNLVATLGSFSGIAGVALDTGETSTRYIGNLADGASFPLYFYVNYPCQLGSNPPPIASSFSVSVSDGVTAALSSGALTLTTRSEVSANAGGKVLSSTIGPGAVLGQIIPMTVQYDFGNPGGEQIAMIQPAGNVNFDGGCFRLMSVDITGITGFTAGLTTSTDDQLYFTGVSGASSNTATVVYYFKMLCSSVSTTANPFSDLTSGGQLKYTGNFGYCSGTTGVCPSYPPPTKPFTIGKTAAPTNLPTGGTATYTIVLTNPSAYATKIDKIVDVLPAGITFAAIGGGSQVTAANSSSLPSAGAGGTLTFQGQPTTSCVGGTCNGSYDIAANGTLTLVYTANVPNSAGSYTNSVAASVETEAIGPTTATVTVGTPGLSLTKSDGNTTAAPGGTVVYALTYQNTGNVPLTGVTLAETVPANTSFSAASSTVGWSCAGTGAGSACTFSVGSLAVGASGTANFAVAVNGGVPAGTTQISNSATATASGGTSASASDTTPITTSPALSLSKSDGGLSATPGGAVVYTLSYQNTGNIDLTGVVLTETVPANSTFRATGSTAGWSCANGAAAGTTCTLSVGPLGAGVSGAATFAVNAITPMPAGATQLSNSATMSASGGTTASAGDTTPIAASPALSLSKSDGGVTTTPGGVVVYTLSYQNTGNIGLTGVVLTETVPANTTFRATGSTAGWSCANGAAAGTTCTLSIGALVGGASGSATFALSVANPVSAGTTQISNAASIGDGTTSANASDTTPVSTAPGLSIGKTDGGVSTTPGGAVVYTISYQNTGNIDLSGVVVNEIVPGNTTFRATGSTAGWSCANGAAAGTTCTLTLGTLAGGASGTATFAVNVITPVPAGTTQLVNGVTITNGTTSATNADITPVNTSPALSLSKSDGNVSTTPGGTVVYTLSYQNTGDVGLTGVVLTETVPANTTFNSGASAGGWSCADGSPAGSVCTLTVGVLAGGTGGTSTFAVAVAGHVPFGTTQISNNASVTASGGTTASASDSTPVTTTPALSLSKSDGGASVVPGGTIVYTLSYQNTGDVGLNGLTLTETVPANTTFNSGASAGAWSCASGGAAGATCTLAVGALAGGASGAANFAVTVDTPLPAGATQVANSATISDGTTSANGGDTTPIVASPALSLSKSDNGATTTPGGTVVYTLSYANTGNIGLTGVTLTETVPANTTFNSGASAGAWSCASGGAAGATCTLSVGGLVAGASGTADFAVTVGNPVPAGTTQIDNGASIAAAGGTSANAGDSTPVSTTPGLTLTKSDGGASVAPGGTAVYTLDYANTGNVGLSGLTLTETVPSNTTFNAASSSLGWSCATGAAAGTTCTLSIGTLAGGATGTAYFAVTVNNPVAAGATQISNSATISNGTTSATNGDSTPVTSSPSLSLTKSDGNVSAAPGGTVAYTLSYRNTGNIGLAGVTLDETVPTNTTFSAAGSTPGWSCANGSPAGTACSLSAGTLAGGALGSATFAVTVNKPLPAGTTQIANSATIGSGGTSASDGDTTPVTTSPALSLSKSDGGASAAPGGVAVYTLSYQNTGDVDLDMVKLHETVPANTTFDSANSTPGWSCANGAVAGTTCIFTVGNLAGAANDSADFAVAVVSPLPAGTSQITNSATIADDNTGASKAASDSTPVTSSPSLSLSKSDSGATTTPGGTIVYTLSYQNTGNIGLAGVVVHETVPANTTFNSASSTGTWSCANGSPAGTACDLTVGGLVAGASGSANFAVKVVSPVPVGTTQIANSATIGDGGANASASASDSTPVSTTPGLTLSKSDGGTTTVPGGTVLYTLSYANTGNVGLTGVALDETVPLNTTFNAGASSGGWSCADGSPAGTTCVLSVGALAGSATGSATFAVTVDNPVPTGGNQIANSATITASGGTSASNGDGTPVVARPDLTLTKSDGGASAVPGGVVAYTLTYANVGNQHASGVILTETVPAHTTFAAAGSTAGWSCANGSPAGSTCNFTVGSVLAGASGSATFAVTVVSSLPSGVGQVANSASVDDDGVNGADPAPANNTAGDTTPVTAAPDLTLTNSDGGASAVPGGVVAYTLTYANAGNQDAAGVTLTQIVPANATFNAASSSPGWSCVDGSPAGTICTFTVGDLAAGVSGQAIFAITVVSPLPAGVTQIDTSATVADDGGNGADPTPANNTAGDTTPVTAAPDLTVTNSDGGATTVPGGTVVYTLAYANVGNQDASGVILAETVPANATFNAASSSPGWSCANASPAGTTCTFTVGNLAAGASGSVGFAVRVVNPLPAGGNLIADTVTIADDGGNGADPTPANNTASDSTPVTTTPGLTLSKSDGGATTVPGGTVVYTLAYANTGNVGLAGVTLTETVPANTTFDAAGSAVGWSCPNGSSAGTTCTLTVGGLAAGASGAAGFAVVVNNPLPAGVTQIGNAASIGDGTTSVANSDSTPVTTAPALTLSKTDGGGSVAPGGTIVYTLSYANTGNVGLAGVTIDEIVPVHTTFVAAGSTAGWSCASGSAAGTPCALTIGLLPAGTSGSVTFVVAVGAPLPAGVTQVVNAATVADAGGTSASANDTTGLNVSPALSLSKDDNGATVTPGGSVVYTLSYANTGNVGLTGVTLTETVPANTTFDATNSAAGWSCADGAPAGTSCTLAIGTLAGGANGATTFAVKAVAPLPASVSQVSNSATIASGGTSAFASDTTPVSTSPGLGLNKSDGGVTVTPGGTVVYTLSYANTGNVGLTGVTLTETVPANTTFDAASSAAGWSCADGSPAGATCTLAIGTLAGGASGSAAFGVTVLNSLPAGVSQVSNSATIASGGTSASSGDNTPILTAPGLSLNKSDGGVTATPGGTVAYTLSYGNSGNVGLTGVTLTETVPANTTFDAASSAAGWSCADGSPAGATCTLTIGSLASGASGAAIFAVVVDNLLPAGVSRLDNTATIADGGGASASNGDSTPVTTSPGLSLTKSASGAATAPGATIVYTLSYRNTGNVGLTSVVIGEQVPANTTFDAAGSTVGWSCANGSPAGTSCTFPIASLAGGASGTVTFAVVVDSPLAARVSQLTNTATISGGGASDTGSATTPVSAAPALSLSKSDGGASSAPGGTIVYTLSYRNTGDIDLDAVFLDEIVPSNTTFDAAGSTAGWSCADGALAGTSCTLALNPLGGGASGSALFAVKVDAPLLAGAHQIDNTATVADDAALVSASGGDSTPVVGAPILSAQKTVSALGGAVVRPGDVLKYTITVRNTGNMAATGVTFADKIPANTTYVAGSTTLNGAPVADVAGAMPYVSGGAINTPGELSGQVNVGKTATIAFRVKIDSSLPTNVTQLSNQATVAGAGVPKVSTDDPNTSSPNDTTVIAISRPTAVTLVSFTATRDSRGVLVRWATSAELNTWGFYLLRSPDGRREHAARVTSSTILAQGHSGASYSWVDTSAADGVGYSYWLEEIETEGAVNEYGPAIVAVGPVGTATLFLAVMIR